MTAVPVFILRNPVAQTVCQVIQIPAKVVSNDGKMKLMYSLCPLVRVVRFSYSKNKVYELVPVLIVESAANT